MFCTGGDDINSRGIYTAMSENISELGNVLFDAVECTGKQMTKIVREYLISRYPCLLTQCFHFTPDVTSAHRLTGFSDKDTPRGDPLGLDIIQ